MLTFTTKHGYKGWLKKEGMLWWKKWRVYLVVKNHYTILEELPGNKPVDEIVGYLRYKYPEIIF